MVKFLCVLLFLSPSLLSSLEIRSEILPVQTHLQKALEGNITMIHKPEELVDQGSFYFEDAPLSVTKIGTEKPSSNLWITKYSFSIKNPGKGLHLLSSVLFKLNDSTYQSPPSSYTIQQDTEDEPLRIRAKIISDGPLYPGQTAKIVYEIFFRGNISLSKEKLPLLGAAGFVKIGSLEVETKTHGSYHVQEITQRVQASKPGIYQFGPSIIEGTLYEGTITTQVSAQAPELTVQIKPFPEEGMPHSFNGALGEYQMALKTLSPLSLTVGDHLKLRMTISGNGPLSTVEMPDLACQPGISGFFELGDLPPIITIEKNKKLFNFELRPLSSAVHEIPPLQFSFFNPEMGNYVTKNSEMIPLQLSPLEPDLSSMQKPMQKEAAIGTEKINWEIALKEGPKPTLADPYLITAKDLKRLPSLFWYLLVIPFGMIFLWLQKNLKQDIEKIRTSKKPKESYFTLENAKKYKSEPDLCYRLIQQSLIQRLEEQGRLPHTPETIYQLPQGDVRTFLETLMKASYSKSEVITPEQAIKEAENLYKKI